IQRSRADPKLPAIDPAERRVLNQVLAILMFQDCSVVAEFPVHDGVDRNQRWPHAPGHRAIEFHATAELLELQQRKSLFARLSLTDLCQVCIRLCGAHHLAESAWP